MIGDCEPAPVRVAPPSEDGQLTVYPVTTALPLLVGAVNATTAEESPRETVTPVGAPGTVAATNDADADDAAPTPTALVATTEQL